MLDLRTPMSKVTRVSRKVDPTTIVANPGIWLSVDANGVVSNVGTDANAAHSPAVAKLCIGSASSNVYESNDVKVGRITTVETDGIRAGVDSDGYTGSPTAGAELAVSMTSGSEGKLKVAVSGNTIVAIAEGAPIAGVLTFVTASPSLKA